MKSLGVKQQSRKQNSATTPLPMISLDSLHYKTYPEIRLWYTGVRAQF